MQQTLVGSGWVLGAFLAYTVVCLFIGYISSKGENTIEQFSLGGRVFGPVVIAFTYFSTRLSASAYLGEPGFIYKFGWPYHWIGVFNAAFWLAAVLVLTRRIRLYSDNLKTMTVPDFLGERYQSSFLRVYTGLLMVLFYILIMYAQYKGVVALFSTLLGWAPVSILVVFTLVVLVYVSMGGFKAVVYTDVFQGVLMIALTIVLWAVSFSKVGWSYAGVNQKLMAMDPNLVSLSQPSGLFSTIGVIALPFYLFISLVTNPYCAMRMMAIRDTKRKTFFTFTATLLTAGMVCFLMYNMGLFARVLYPALQDPDTAIPTLLGNLLPTPLAAIMMVGLFAAIMSTVDSLLHSVSSTISRDIYQKTLNPQASDQQTALAAKITTAVVSFIVLGISLYQLPKMLSLVGLIAAGGSGILTLSPLLFGLYWDRSTATGAISSSIAGIACFAYFTWVIPINVWERGVLSAVISVAVMWVVSLLTKPVPSSVLQKMKSGSQKTAIAAGD